MQLNNRVAVITGAGGGIGRAIALALARKGCHLALCDVDAAALARVAAELSALGGIAAEASAPGGIAADRAARGGLPADGPAPGRVPADGHATGGVAADRSMTGGVRYSTHRLDVADRAAVSALPQQVQASHPEIHLLINNAGVALGGTFEQVGADDFDWLMEINFHAVVRMTRAFLPALRRAGECRIVNMSSVYGLVSPPGQAAYSASKFAVRGFSNALRHELAGTGVGVTVVHPGGVATAIARSARLPSGIDAAQAQASRKAFDRMLRLPPERAADTIVAGIEHDAARVVVGNDARIAALLERLLPVRHMQVLAWLARR